MHTPNSDDLRQCVPYYLATAKLERSGCDNISKSAKPLHCSLRLPKYIGPRILLFYERFRKQKESFARFACLRKARPECRSGQSDWIFKWNFNIRTLKYNETRSSLPAATYLFGSTTRVPILLHFQGQFVTFCSNAFRRKIQSRERFIRWNKTEVSSLKRSVLSDFKLHRWVVNSAEIFLTSTITIFIMLMPYIQIKLWTQMHTLNKQWVHYMLFPKFLDKKAYLHTSASVKLYFTTIDMFWNETTSIV